MQFIQGKNRTQVPLYARCLDETISQSNEVRIIDLFVESIAINDYNFVIKKTIEGRPAYHPKDLLKLYVYGYLNSIRSSRVLEKECKRNIELMWLMKELTPDHNTISNFRRDNSAAIKKVFRQTVSIAKQFDLIGGKLIAGDSTKLRAQNSKKNNFNPKKIERHLAYIEDKLNQYNAAMAEADEDNKKIIEKEIQKQNERKEFYNDLSKQLEETGETQISTSDPESRQLITRNNITEVAYNIQTTTDAKHNIPIDYKVTNENDSKAMGNMLRRTKTILKTTDFTALYDKGYHTGSEIKTAVDLGIDIMVAIPDVASNAPDVKYNVANFKYDEKGDTYTCPQGNLLVTNGRWYKKDRGKSFTQMKHYKTNRCHTCPVKDLCTKNKEGRLIERSEHAPYIEQNRLNIEANPKIYKQRQAIIEHNYGIIKRQWGFYYIITKKGIKRASADVGLIFVAYNLRRIITIIGQNGLKKFFQELVRFVFEKTAFVNTKSFILTNQIFKTNILVLNFNRSINASFKSVFFILLL
jgi:transposase